MVFYFNFRVLRRFDVLDDRYYDRSIRNEVRLADSHEILKEILKRHIENQKLLNENAIRQIDNHKILRQIMGLIERKNK